MKRKRILCFALSFAAVACMFLVRDSVAWVDTSTGQPLGQNITASKLFFVFAGNLGTAYSYDTMTGVTDVTGEFILTGQNLIVDNGGRLTATNYSTIATEIRVLVKYDKYNSATSSMDETEYTGSGDDIVVEFADGWTKGAGDNYFAPAGELAATGGTGVPVPIINGLYYDADETYSGLDAEVTVIVQAKQAEHVDWSTLRTWVATLP